jgi:hypothetical protein
MKKTIQFLDQLAGHSISAWYRDKAGECLEEVKQEQAKHEYRKLVIEDVLAERDRLREEVKSLESALGADQ